MKHKWAIATSPNNGWDYTDYPDFARRNLFWIGLAAFCAVVNSYNAISFVGYALSGSAWNWLGVPFFALLAYWCAYNAYWGPKKHIADHHFTMAMINNDFIVTLVNSGIPREVAETICARIDAGDRKGADEAFLTWLHRNEEAG